LLFILALLPSELSLYQFLAQDDFLRPVTKLQHLSLFEQPV
jgi:hypothetical protein